MTIRINKTDQNTYRISKSGKNLGTIRTHRNLYHDTCTYLDIDLKNYVLSFPFSVIRKYEGKPLQVMTDSENKEFIQFLIHNGFECKRRCYTPTFTEKDLKYPITESSLIYSFDQVDSRYRECCKLLYQYYKEAHASVSPLTMDRLTFINEVPTKTGFYSLNKSDKIENIVFTENNEVAYVCSLNRGSFRSFIQTVLSKVFSKFETIYFEADDTDWAASILLDQFKFDKRDSFNTYIYS